MAITTTPETFLPPYTSPEDDGHVAPAPSPGADYPYLEPAPAPSDEDLVKTALEKPTYTIYVDSPKDAEEYNLPPPPVSAETLEDPRLEEQQAMSDLDTIGSYTTDLSDLSGAAEQMAQETAESLTQPVTSALGEAKQAVEAGQAYVDALSEEAITLVSEGRQILGDAFGLVTSTGEAITATFIAALGLEQAIAEEQIVEKLWGVPPYEQGYFDWYVRTFEQAPYDIMGQWRDFLFGDDVKIDDALTYPQFRRSLGYCFTYGSGAKSDGSPVTGVEFRAAIIAGFPKAYGKFELMWNGGVDAVLFAPEATEESLAATKEEWLKLQPWYGQDPLEGSIRLMTPSELAAQAEKMKASVWYKTVTDSFIRNRLMAGWSMDRINGTLPNYKIFMAFQDFQLAAAAKQILRGIYPAKPAAEINTVVTNKLVSANWNGKFRNQGATRKTAVWAKMINAISTQKPTQMCVGWNIITQAEADMYRDKFGISEAEIQAQYAVYVADLKAELDKITTPLEEAVAVTGQEVIDQEENFASIMGMEGGGEAAPAQLAQANIPTATVQTIMANNPGYKFAENAPSYRNPYTGDTSRPLFHSGHAFSPRWIR